MSKFWLFGFLVIFGQTLLAQQQDYRDTTITVTIGRILLSGNQVTHQRIIFRELSLNSGDSVLRSELAATLAQEQKKIYNLRLFNRVNIEPLELESGKIDLLIEVQERWYTYPVPIFELSDRNFNEWWENYNRDFSRVNYGLRLFQYNFRGRNETLRLTARFGFSKRFDLYYKIPNLTRNQKHGLLFEYVYSEPFNVAYRTDDHILSFLSDDKPLRTGNSGAATYIFRKSFYRTHSIRAGFMEISISDSIRKLNPAYLTDGRSTQYFSSLTYKFVAEHRDVIAYPLKGYQWTAGITSIGIRPNESTHFTNITASLAWHKEFGHDLYFSLYSMFSFNSSHRQPYALIYGIGYDRQYIRGYERFVIEGPNFNLNKFTMKKRIFNREYSVGNMKFSQFRHLPIAIYLKGFADVGYVQNYPFYENSNMNTRLTNTPLAGAGIGLDIVTYYDSVLRFEYTFTSQATSGLFLNIKKEF